MTTQVEKAIDLADKIAARAENAVAALEREMVVMKWPSEFRVIMWEAVAAVANQRAANDRRS